LLPNRKVIVKIWLKDVPDIRFQLAGYPVIFHYPVPHKLLTDTGYLRFSLLTVSLTVLCNLYSPTSHIAVQASAL